jgi:cardiolipin synthase C
LALFYDRDVSKQSFSFEEQVLKCINSARRSLTIETPYPAFSHKFKLALIRAARRGVRVTLLTNSISNSDQPTTMAALLNQKRAMLRAGIEIREYRGRGLIHAKSLIVDRTVAWVGSYNFDPRGDRLNLELCLRVTDPKLAEAIEDGTLRRNVRSESVTLANLGRLGREIPWSTRLQIRSFQFLMPVLRSSL